MRTDILDLVKSLSATDTKTLSQKSLKLAEETGELAGAVLPYELAAGTLHRVVHKGNLLEEAVDNVLVALSIAYSLGFDDNDIAGVMQRKALYWSQLQGNEQRDPNKIPFEIHVTVHAAENLDHFKADCKAIGVKPILLDLHTKTEGTIKDMMTSQVVVGSTNDAFYVMNTTIAHLNKMDYHVVRAKIEAAPWHPAAPNVQNGLRHVEDNYFESHLEVYIDDTSVKNTLLHLRGLLEGYRAHISANAFKAFGDVYTVMVTVRRHEGTIESFRDNVAFIRSRISDCGFKMEDKSIIEYSIYDSNVDHDKSWIGK